MLVTRPSDIEGATRAAECVVKAHERLVGFLREGQTLAEIDSFVGRTLADLDAPSCFVGYRIRGHPPFPSHACLSVNQCVVHGTHDMRASPLRRGDLISIDIGVRHKGWIGDAAWTYAIKERDPVSEALMKCGVESRRRGIAALRPDRSSTSRRRCRDTSRASAGSASCAASVVTDTARNSTARRSSRTSFRAIPASGPRLGRRSSRDSSSPWSR
jgi:methionine aminopeptidase